MSPERLIPLTIIASREELPPEERIWGDGGWLMPEQREALDWLTLGLLLGWDPVILYAEDPLPADVLSSSRVIVVAIPPHDLPEESRVVLQTVLDHQPVAVIARAAAPASPWESWASVSATPWREENILWKQASAGKVFTLLFHPSEIRDASGEGTALLRRLLLTCSSIPVDWIDLSGVMVLRMDDPGGSQNVHCVSWCYPKLSGAQWDEIASDLRSRGAKMTIGYVAGWVDDGEEQRGRLWISGAESPRIPGAVHRAWEIRHQDLRGHAPGRVNDYQAEYLGIRGLVDAGVASVEVHGYTHMTPDRSAWLAASDRYENTQWFRELNTEHMSFVAGLPACEHPLAKGLSEIEHAFRRPPTTLICPGEAFTKPALEAALSMGFRIVGSYYLGIRWKGRLCWSTHVCSPYLDRPDAGWFSSGLPVIGYFHDKDAAEYGVSWFRQYLAQWEHCGARRFIDYATLAETLCRIG
jgi:hypothetical protein